MFKRCIFVLFPERQLERNPAGIMAPVITWNITALNHDSIPELVEATLDCLENGSLNFTTNETILLTVNGRATWTLYHHNGRWKATDFAYLRAEE